jgi:hypothetical protein
MSRAEASELNPATTTMRSHHGRVRAALVILVPAAALSVVLHVWAVMSPAAPVNADEAMTGLQAYNVLKGDFSPIVEGNDYGGALESYLLAPLLLATGGTVAIKLVPILLSFGAGVGLAWACAPLLGRRVAFVVCGVSWVSSGAAVVLWSLNYLGYASGATAMIVALGFAVRLTTRPARWLAFGAGLAAGLALWGHPIYGVVAALGCIPVFAVRRRWTAVLPAVVGALLGGSPWLVYLVRHGLPRVPTNDQVTTYPQTLRILVTELLPSGFGLRSPTGVWLEPFALTVTIAVVLIVGALAGLILLPRWAGAAALPFTIAGVGAVPVLGLFQALAFSADGRYASAFMPTLLVGLFGWTRLRRSAAHPPLGLAAAVPIVWGVLACVPSLHATAGWTWQDPNLEVERAVVALQQRDITAVRGGYWAVYVLDYYAEGRLDAWPDGTQRLPNDVARAQATPPSHVAFVYETGSVDAGVVTLPGSRSDYTLIPAGRWEMWVPAP